MAKKPSYTQLYPQLGYHFNDPELLEQALTHSSVGKVNNERLEFLGDSILSFIMTEHLYHLYPEVPEGQLTRLRATLVKGPTLAKIAQQLQLGEYLNLGSSELKSGGHSRPSILADALEALIAAITLEAGVEQAKKCVLQWFASLLDKLDPNENQKDPKTQLQEYAQGHGLPLPNYEVLNTAGEPHRRIFTVKCSLGINEMIAKGNSRRNAEQQAAQLILEQLYQSS